MDAAAQPTLPPLAELSLDPGVVSVDQWRAMVNKVLDRSGSSGPEELQKAFDARLRTTTLDGITLEPLYTAAHAGSERTLPGSAPFVRGSSAGGSVIGGWDIRALQVATDPAEVARDVVDDLEGGATSLWLKVGETGLPLGSLATALQPVLLDLAGVVLDAGDDGVAAAHELEAMWSARGLEPTAVSGSLGLDPLGWAAQRGAHPDLVPAIAVAVAAAERYPQVRPLVADGTVLHDAGATDAQELAGAITAGIEYLRALVDAGLPVDLALEQIEFRLSATADQFATIAKFRAARRLWAQVARTSGADLERQAGAGALRLHAVTSWAMLSRRDPWVNLLRSTVAAFAAGVAGAQSVTVLPFDLPLGIPDALGRRLARNTSALLIEESGLARVIDPAGGSWFVESYTEQLAAAAWTLVQQYEAAGGFSGALAQGLIADHVESAFQERSNRIAHRRDPLTGVSEFPHIDEQPLERRPLVRRVGTALPARRYSEPFEMLRDRCDAAAAAGQPPTVLLVALGDVSQYTARATFAKNFYEAGGIRTRVMEWTDTTGDMPADLQQAVRGGDSVVVCVVSSDDVYAHAGSPAVRALVRAGVGTVHIAGGSPALRTELIDAGATRIIALGDDVLAAAAEVLAIMGVPA